MPFFKDFKKFISRGNVIDIAIGIILGTSFTKMVDAMVNHILMPPLGILAGGIDFSYFKITLKKATEITPEIVMDLGLFINTLLDFFMVGLAMYAVIKILNRFHMETAFFTKKICPECKMEVPIDALRCGHCTSIF